MWKARSGLSIVLINVLLDVTAEALRANTDGKQAFLKRVGQFRPNFT